MFIIRGATHGGKNIEYTNSSPTNGASEIAWWAVRFDFRDVSAIDKTEFVSFLLGIMREVDEIQVRPFSTREEYELMVDYFYKADDTFLRRMGVDRLKLPERDKWLDSLLADHRKPDDERDRFYLIWTFRGQRVGHSSINKIVVGTEAFIHLHLWDSQLRRAGLGTEFVRRSASFYFQRFNLKKIVCEPRADNPSPNRVLQKLGFAFIRRYRTTPGFISYEQNVNRYELKRPNQLRKPRL